MADRVGTDIAGYRIESLLARGGMGEVYLAEQTSPRRKVALKLLSPELSGDPGFRERFARESEAAASVEHPNVIPIYQSGESNGALYIAMRYVEGEDLRSLLNRVGPLPPERAVAICAQVAEALQEAHDHGLVHRDVKPGNILIAKGDRAYLTDFGLIRRSQVETDLTKTGQFMGTLDYVAPEQIKGEEVDGRADVYSLGCVLYECLTGERPFPRETEVATLYAHLEDAPPKPSAKNSHVPLELDEVIERAMAKRPDERHASTGEMAIAAQSALAHRVAVPAPSPTHPRRWVVASGAAALALVVAVVVVVALGADNGAAPETPPVSPGVVLQSGLMAFDPKVDQTSTKVPGRLGLGAFEVPVVLAAGEGALWTSDLAGLVRVDPETGNVKEIDLGLSGRGCKIGALAVASGQVWVLCNVSELLRVDPFTYKVRVERTGAHGGGYALPQGTGLIVDNTTAWVSLGDGTLRRVDTVSGKPTGTVRGVNEDEFTLADGRLWLVDRLGSTVTPVDPRTLTPGSPITLQGNIDAITAGQGSLWVLDSSGGIVTEIDTHTEAVSAPFGIGPGGDAIAYGFGAVWVANSRSRTLTRIDPLTRQTQTFHIGASAIGITPDPASGKLWLVVATVRG